MASFASKSQEAKKGGATVSRLLSELEEEKAQREADRQRLGEQHRRWGKAAEGRLISRCSWLMTPGVGLTGLGWPRRWLLLRQRGGEDGGGGVARAA